MKFKYEATLTMSPGYFGSYNWTLNISKISTENGEIIGTKSFFLGQDAKVISRIMGLEYRGSNAYRPYKIEKVAVKDNHGLIQEYKKVLVFKAKTVKDLLKYLPSPAKIYENAQEWEIAAE